MSLVHTVFVTITCEDSTGCMLNDSEMELRIPVFFVSSTVSNHVHHLDLTCIIPNVHVFCCCNHCIIVFENCHAGSVIVVVMMIIAVTVVIIVVP